MTTIPAAVMREAKSREFKASVRIGKAGVTDTLIDEIRQQLASRSLVKIKANKGLIERDQRQAVWDFIAESTGGVLVLQRGNIGVLWRSQ